MTANGPVPGRRRRATTQEPRKKKRPPSQLMELFVAIAAELGFDSDEDLASLADVGPENVANWRSGAVREFKAQKFGAARDNLIAQLRSLRAQAGLTDGVHTPGLSPLEIEEGSSPTDLQRQFRDLVEYDYCGHRFLYFEPQGALAWEKLIKAGYDQGRWLDGVKRSTDAWLDGRRDGQGQTTGPIARALRLERRERPRGLDVISLGPGDGEKELAVLRRLLEAERDIKQRVRWLTFAPVDVSIPLLVSAARRARDLFAAEEYAAGRAYRAVLPFCADFEDSNLTFLRRLRTSADGPDGLRLVLVLGNVLGNLRDEEAFVRQRLARLARPGDLVWLEVGLRMGSIEDDPLYAMTLEHEETAAVANRRLLLEGPYRRLSAALGRATPDLALRVWLREDDDTTRVPGSVNFCHDLLIKDQNRVCTMLYSRRYDLTALSTWFEARGFEVLGMRRTRDSKDRPRVGHLLLQRKAE